MGSQVEGQVRAEQLGQQVTAGAVTQVRLEDLPHRPVPMLGIGGGALPQLTQVMHLLGLNMGATPQLTPESPGAWGWESEHIVRINQRLLTAAGCADDCRGDEAQLLGAASRMPALVDGALPLISKVTKAIYGGGQWGLSDPRLAVTLPFWIRAWQRLGIAQIRPLILVTSPQQYLASAVASGEVSERARLHYWQAYYGLLEQTAPAESLWVLQDDLVSRERRGGIVDRCAAELALSAGRRFAALCALEEADLGRRTPLGSQIDVAAEALYGRLSELAVQSDASQAARQGESTLSGLQAGRYCVYVVSPVRAAAARPFEDHALALQAGLRDLGYRAPLVTQPWQVHGTPIVLGSHLLSEQELSGLPSSAILYNLEQASEGSPWLNERYLQRLRQFTAWDYDRGNQEKFQAMGVTTMERCEVGCDPLAPPIELLAEDERDIDVLFYGSQNARRMRVLSGLAAAGLRVVALYNLYGAQRDAFVRRAKLVLNMHFYSAQVLEVIRISYLMANGVCVVTEPGADPTVVEGLRDGLIVSDYEALVPSCVAAVRDAERRRSTAQAASRLFRQRSQASYLALVIKSDGSKGP